MVIKGRLGAVSPIYFSPLAGSLKLDIKIESIGESIVSKKIIISFALIDVICVGVYFCLFHL